MRRAVTSSQESIASPGAGATRSGSLRLCRHSTEVDNFDKPRSGELPGYRFDLQFWSNSQAD